MIFSVLLPDLVLHRRFSKFAGTIIGPSTGTWGGACASRRLEIWFAEKDPTVCEHERLCGGDVVVATIRWRRISSC